MLDTEKIVSDFCREYDLKITFSADMPSGYESANGTFDIEKNTLFFNSAMLADAPNYEVMFYLFHELRHVLQYTRPHLFNEAVRRSINYVVMYNGTCFKTVCGEWKECSLSETETRFEDAYLGQPYELDANRYAYEKTKALCGASQKLDELYAFWIPQHELSDAEYAELYRKIDAEIERISGIKESCL